MRRTSLFHVFTIVIAIGFILPRPGEAGEFGELLGGPKDGHVNLHPSEGVWIGVDGAPKIALPPSKQAIRVAMIDSGGIVSHPQLRGLIVGMRDFSGEGIEDKDGHGTVDAIIVLKAQALVAPKMTESASQFLIAKVTRMHNGKARPLRSAVIEAIKWAASQKAQIVNLSLGFSDEEEDNAELCSTIRGLDRILFVAAAGNSGPQIREFPAACETPNLISVTVPKPWGGPGEIVAPGTVSLSPLK